MQPPEWPLRGCSSLPRAGLGPPARVKKKWERPSMEGLLSADPPASGTRAFLCVNASSPLRPRSLTPDQANSSARKSLMTEDVTAPPRVMADSPAAMDERDHPLMGFDRRVAQAAWSVALVAGLLYAVYAVRQTLFIFILGLFFAYLIYPLARVAALKRPRLSRVVSAGIVFGLLKRGAQSKMVHRSGRCKKCKHQGRHCGDRISDSDRLPKLKPYGLEFRSYRRDCRQHSPMRTRPEVEDSKLRCRGGNFLVL